MGLIGLLMTPMLHGLRARARRAAGLPRRARRAGSSGSRSSAARSPRARTSPTRSRRARCAAPSGLDLSSWRLALNGAEPVDPAAVEAFCAAAAPLRVRRQGARSRVFGMAEATLAVTFPALGAGMEVDTVDRDALEHERYAAPAPPTAATSTPAGAARPPAPRLRAAHRATPRPAPRSATAKSASSSSAARR